MGVLLAVLCLTRTIISSTYATRGAGDMLNLMALGSVPFFIFTHCSTFYLPQTARNKPQVIQYIEQNVNIMEQPLIIKAIYFTVIIIWLLLWGFVCMARPNTVKPDTVKPDTNRDHKEARTFRRLMRVLIFFVLLLGLMTAYIIVVVLIERSFGIVF